MKEDKPVVISNKKKRYEEAVKKFELEERINQQMKYKKDDITTKIMSNWFAILYHMNERELIQDLQLVYDNNDDRSNVYDLYIKCNLSFQLKMNQWFDHKLMSGKLKRSQLLLLRFQIINALLWHHLTKRLFLAHIYDNAIQFHYEVCSNEAHKLPLRHIGHKNISSPFIAYINATNIRAKVIKTPRTE